MRGKSQVALELTKAVLNKTEIPTGKSVDEISTTVADLFNKIYQKVELPEGGPRHHHKRPNGIVETSEQKSRDLPPDFSATGSKEGLEKELSYLD